VNKSLLRVEGLRTYYHVDGGEVKAVDGVDFSLYKGKSIGIVGESGCGKTTLGYSIINFIPPNGRIVKGRIQLDDMNISVMSEAELRKRIRWKKISMIFQEAMNCLNPFYTVGNQMIETLLIHSPEIKGIEASELVRMSLKNMDLGTDVIDMYPHELSGGMKQRVVIAMSLMLDPDIIIADEPTSALDVIIQARILNMLKNLQKKLELSLILITHDLSIVSEVVDYVAVMYAGEFIEYGPLSEIYKSPSHPYTYLLLESIPKMMGKKSLRYIPGTPPNLKAPPYGCRFNPRCPYAIKKCKVKEPTRTKLAKNHFTKCHRIGEKLW
jgi:peptide/nickel transport system ATP-binding protein